MNRREEPMVVSFGETARNLSSTPRAVKGMVKSGLLVGVRLPGRVRYSGVTYESLAKLITEATATQKQAVEK